jgi:4-hydroxyphenylpyruvate dioxygenase-like putative hemolysin
VSHVALEVCNVHEAVETLRERGLQFDTDVIAGPGLTQSFSSRDPNSGMCIELIARSGEQGFQEDNVQQLFDQLERAGKC